MFCRNISRWGYMDKNNIRGRGVNKDNFDRGQTTLDLPLAKLRGEVEIPPVDRYEAAFLLSAVGDALGWPTEFLRQENAQRFLPSTPLSDFIKWRKLVGGRWWGYFDEIEPGQYSDDTQLNLAVARSIDDLGNLNPAIFAYYELPLWLHYQRGGGRSVKAAARSLIESKADWFNNF